jgi:2-hydroxy-6-oxonona-2,4-dienedioate hydrolase
MKLPDNFEHCFVEVLGRPVHYVVSTNPVDPYPPLVLIHGVGLSYRYLMPYAEQMAKYFRVFVPDQFGFGKSHKPNRVLRLPELADGIAYWMEAMGIERAALMGNSVGCQVIVNLAVRHPDRVLRAVLQGPTVDPATRTFFEQMRLWQQNGKNEKHKRNPLFYPDYWECGFYRLLATFGYALEDPTEKKYPHMKCPTLVVRGALDPIVPQRWSEEVARLLPRGRLVLLPGVPHTANLEAPLELMRVTRPFFEEERQRARPRAWDRSQPVHAAG